MPSSINKVLKNTGWIYAKSGFTAISSLLITKLVISGIRDEGFGFFTVVAGLISIFGFLSVMLSSTLNRVLSVAYYRNSTKDAANGFALFYRVCVFIAVLILVLLLSTSKVVIYNLPQIVCYPKGQLKDFYHIQVLIFSINILQVPFDSVLTSRENQFTLAIISLLESSSKLFMVMFFKYCVGFELLYFGYVLLSASIITLIFSGFYCIKEYPECRFSYNEKLSKTSMNQILHFVRWSSIDLVTAGIFQYSLGYTLNNFFGAVRSASLGIANQISGQVMVFSNALTKAVSPVLLKESNTNENEELCKVSLTSSRWAVFILVFFAVPIFVKAELLITLWLGSDLPHVVLFVRLQLLRSVIEQFTSIIGITVLTHTNIRSFSIMRSIINIVTLFTIIILFKNGFSDYWFYIIWIIFGGCISGFLTVRTAHRVLKLNYQRVISKIIIPGVTIFMVTLCFGFTLSKVIADDLRGLVGVSCGICAVYFSMLYLFLTADERNYISLLLLKLSVNVGIGKKN